MTDERIAANMADEAEKDTGLPWEPCVLSSGITVKRGLISLKKQREDGWFALTIVDMAYECSGHGMTPTVALQTLQRMLPESAVVNKQYLLEILAGPI